MSQPAEDRIHRLQRDVDELLHELERVPEEALYREPAAGEWPVMSIVVHVAEVMPYWAQQAQRIAASPSEQPFGRTHTDPDRIAAVEQHAHDRRDSVIPRVRASLDEAVSILRALPPEAWSRAGSHATRGRMTVEQVVDSFLVGHVEEHTAQLRATLAALRTGSAAPPAP